ncbi:MAG: sugar phosphate isomerase/epimerase, partial [Chloroflexota bacterium]
KHAGCALRAEAISNVNYLENSGSTRRYTGPLSIEWEDSGMDRDWGGPDALAFVRRTDFAPSSVAFDAAFASDD